MMIVAAQTVRVGPHERDAVERVAHVLVEPLVGIAPVARPNEIAGGQWRSAQTRASCGPGGMAVEDGVVGVREVMGEVGTGEVVVADGRAGGN